MANKTSSVKAVFMIVTNMLGVGMYYTPYSFAQSGMVVGISLLLGVAVTTFLSIYSLFRSSKRLEEEIENEKPVELQTLGKVNSKEGQLLVQNTENDPEKQEITSKSSIEISYAGIGKFLNSKLGKVIDVMIVLAGISACLFYQKFICELATTLSGITKEHPYIFWINAGFISLSSVILFVFAQIKDLKKLSWMATVNISIITIIGISVLAMNFLLAGFKEQHVANPNKGNIGFAIGNFIFAMSCQINVVKIFTDLADKSNCNMIFVSMIAPILCGCIYGCVGIAGALLLGENMPKVDIINYLADPSSDIRIYIAKNCPLLTCIPYTMSCLAMLALMISFIFNFSAVTRSLFKIKRLKIKDKSKKWAVITSSCLGIISIINIIPNIKLDVIFSLIGNFISNPLAFIFPFYFASKLFGEKYKFIKFSSYLVMGLSLAFGVGNTIIEFAGGAGQLTNGTTTLLENKTSLPLVN